MKQKLLGLLIIIEITAFVLILASCNPCKQVAKHPECFTPDTIRETEYKTKYIKEIVVNDSIVYDSIPCDPVNPITIKETVYKTNYKTFIDTIYTNKVIDRLNPVNDVLKAENDKLTLKNTLKGKIIWFESILILLIALIVYLKFKL